MKREAILDGDLEGGEVAVDAAVLEFVLGVDLPAALARDAEARVVEDEEKCAFGGEVARRCCEGASGVFHILEGEDEGRAGEVSFGEGK